MPVPLDWSLKLRQFVDEWKRNPRAERYIGDAPFGNFVLTEQANSWRDLLAWSNELRDLCCFRGQREAAWSLLTSLDRAVRRDFLSDSPDGSRVTGYYHLNREDEGRRNLVRFREHVDRYTSNAPSGDDLGSWFALMQHYGTPTRFLDWSRSPFVAAYFALEEELRGERNRSAIWAIDMDWLERRGRELVPAAILGSRGDDDVDRARWENSLLETSCEPIIVRINPLETNHRMVAQQGILLCKLFHEAFFSQTLMRMMIHPETIVQPVVRKLEIDTAHRTEFLRNLRAMNIHKASLFPEFAEHSREHEAAEDFVTSRGLSHGPKLTARNRR